MVAMEKLHLADSNIMLVAPGDFVMTESVSQATAVAVVFLIMAVGSSAAAAAAAATQAAAVLAALQIGEMAAVAVP